MTTLPSFEGVTTLVLLNYAGAYFTGMYVLPSITTGFIFRLVIGTKCSPLMLITAFGGFTNGFKGFLVGLKAFL